MPFRSGWMAGSSPAMTTEKWRDTVRSFSKNSHVEKHRLVVALQANIKTIDRVAVARLARCDQRIAPVYRHQRQHRVGGIGRLTTQIDPRIEMQQHAAREHREQDMRRLRLAVRIRHP